MKKNDEYKPTNIDFLDEIPKKWTEIRMRFLGYLYGGLSGKSATDFNQSENEQNKCFIPFTNIANNFRINPKNLQTVLISKEESQNTVQQGDLFFLMSSENYEDVGKSAVLVDDLGEAYLNSFCKGFRITNKDVVPEFLNYQLHSKQLRHNLLIGANGFTRINLKIDKVIDLLIALPSPTEQTAIASYLDRKTAEIDELIADKKRLLELYEEAKTAIINQAVTKGINPDAPMKDSGIEWLGEIPEHWEVIPLTKYLESIVDYRGRTPKKQNEGIFLVTARNIKNRIIDYSLSEEYVDSEDAQNLLDRGKPKIGDVLFTTEAPLGEVANIDREDIALAQRIIKFRGKIGILNNYYLKFFLSSDCFKQDLYSYSTGSTAIGIKASKLHHLKCLLPPFDEQQKIVDFIYTECAQIDVKKSRTEKLIQLLTEYRTALISEVVTGKIKVTD